MSAWSREQIAQARGIRAKVHVDQTLMARVRMDLMAATRQKMFKNMAHIGHSFAIELNPADVQFREAEDEDHPFCTVMTAWWEPQVDEVEFRGGPRDGMRLAVQQPERPGLVREQQPIDWANVPTEPEPVMSDIVIYVVTGWHEQERVWIYEAT